VRLRNGGLVAALVVGGCLLGACSSNSSSSTTTTAASTSTSTSTVNSSTTVTSSTAPPTTSAGLAQCATSALSGAMAGSSGAAGTIETTVSLKSTAGSPCSLGGYPGLQLLSATGAPLPTSVVRKGSYSFTAMAPTTVTIAPGQSVYFNIGYSDVPEGSETSCPTSGGLEVTPPNATDHLSIEAKLAPCGGGTMAVSPVFLATGDNTQTTAPAVG
jgi:hypothetical protein